MEAHVVIGANYGDEGKGTMVQRLVKGKTLVIMTNGGAQRGHTIISPTGERFVNKHFHSGFLKGADCLFAKSFILNPMEFKVEYERNRPHLCVHDVKTITFYRDVRCRWSTPWDMIANQLDAEFSGSYHTCGMGVWETIKRFELYHFDNFCSLPHKEQMSHLKIVREHVLKQRPKVPKTSKYYDLLTDDVLANGIDEHFIQDCLFMVENTIPVNMDSQIDAYPAPIEHSILNKYDTVIFENGQGLAIGEQNGGDTETQTPSNTGLLGATNNFVNWLATFDSIDVHYVSRTYATRHGDGHMDGSEIKPNKISGYVKEDLTNPFNEFQGYFRYGNLNSFALQTRILKDFRSGPDLIRQKARKILDFTHCDERGAEDIIVSGVDKINYYGDAK